MRFYDRNTEIEELRRIQKLAFEDYSKMTIITGRRRIGKTSLADKVCEDTPTVYLFVAKKAEALLCADFIEAINTSLGIYVPSDVTSFPSIFRMLLNESRDKRFNVIIDEFQNFIKINPSIYSEMQNIWDKLRKQSHINLIVCGSAYSLMHKIFEDEKEPLFGRQDNTLHLSTFPIDTLKEIYADYYPEYTHEDLLALYSFTGGVPKYVELFMDNRIFTKDAMIDFMIRRDSYFIGEGKNLLVEEFGKDYAIYFSILGAISSGTNTQSDIESLIGVGIGGNIKRLVEDYNIIARETPFGSKPATKTIRYVICDNFLTFWFRYIHRKQAVVEIGNFPLLRKIVSDDYTTFTGRTLEMYFRQKMKDSMDYQAIGTWWDPSDKENQCEIDIVCIDALNASKAYAWEIKRNPDKFNRKQLLFKVERLKGKVLKKCDVIPGFLSMDDM